jgi:hypothetical protein
MMNMRKSSVKKPIDNIVIGEPLVPLEKLGISKREETARFTFDELRNEQGNVFLPHLLVKLGIFKSTSECKQINTQRRKSSKFNTDPDQELWRNIERPEFTNFKIGKKVFWLIVGT